MRRKLNVTELEKRAAPSVGLLSFLSNLAANDSKFAALYNQCVDPNTGQVDVAKATSLWNSMGMGSKVAAAKGSFALSDKTVISDNTAAKILAALGKK